MRARVGDAAAGEDMPSADRRRVRERAHARDAEPDKHAGRCRRVARAESTGSQQISEWRREAMRAAVCSSCVQRKMQRAQIGRSRASRSRWHRCCEGQECAELARRAHDVDELSQSQRSPLKTMGGSHAQATSRTHVVRDLGLTHPVERHLELAAHLVRVLRRVVHRLPARSDLPGQTLHHRADKPPPRSPRRAPSRQHWRSRRP